MPVLIAMGNGFLKMVDDGKSPDKPSNFQLVPLDSAPPEVKNVLMEELRSLAEAPPAMPPPESMKPGVGPTMAGQMGPKPGMNGPVKKPTGLSSDMPGPLPPDMPSSMQGEMGPGMGPMPPDMPMDMLPSGKYQRRGY